MATVKELQGSGDAEGSATSSTATRMFWVRPYSAAVAWGQSQIERFNPATGQPFGGRRYRPGDNVFAQSFSVAGIGRVSLGSDGNADYSGGARVTLKFANRPATTATGGNQPGQGGGEGAVGDPSNIPWLEETIGVGAEVMVVRKSDPTAPAIWEWASDGQDITEVDDIQLFKMVCKANWQLTQLYVSPANYAAQRIKIFNACGKVNSTAFASVGVGTLLYMGAQVSRTVQLDGSSYYRIAHQFSYHEKGWQKAYRSAAVGWDTVQGVGGGSKPYETYLISTLIPGLA